MAISHAKAEDSYVEVNNETQNETPTITQSTTEITPIPTNVPVGRRIDQGACVMPGETIDIAGISWYTGYLAYYGKYYDGFSGLGNYTMDATYKIKAMDLDHFYLDPDFFSNYPGYWYVLDPYQLGESSANDRLFYVSNSCNISAKESIKIVQKAINESEIRRLIISNQSRLPIKNETGIDIIISKNTSISFDAPAFSHQWIFGNNNDDTNYDITIPQSGVTIFSKEITNALSEGRYDIVFVKPGKNGILEETYNNELKIIESPFRNVEDINVYGFSSRVVEDRLLKRISGSYDDSYEIWKADIQEPSIQIAKLWQTPLTNNHSLIVIAGYTNANEGDDLTIQMDANKTNGETYVFNTWHTKVINNGGLSSYRTWNLSFIANFNGIFPGPHDITVRSNDGAKMIAPIYVYRELFDHYKPPQYLEYIDNSPFIPPVIQTVTVPVTVFITQIVHDTPSEEQVYNAQMRAVNTSFWSWFAIVMCCIIGLYGAYRIGKYLIDVKRRAE